MIFARARRRLMMLNVAVLVVIIAALGVMVLVLMDHVLLAVETTSIQDDLARTSDWGRDVSMGRQRPPPRDPDALFYIVWDVRGDAVYDPAGVAGPALRRQAMQALAGRAEPSRIKVAGGHDALVGVQSFDQSGQVVGVVQVGHSLAPIDTVEREALIIVGLASLGAVLLSLVASWFLAGRALVPIGEALHRQRQFTADASHELRTPLTVVDAGIQVLRRHPSQRIDQNADVIQSMSAQAQRMGRLLGGLLALARADSGEAELEIARVDVDELARTTARDFAPRAGERRARISVGGDAPLVADLDPDRIRQLLVILLDNALTHSPPGANVQMTFRRHDRGLLLEVADDGPGIPAAERARVFERFHQIDPSRSGAGAGLGLAIARWIVAAHRGSISLHDNQPGLRVRVELPTHPRREGRRAGLLARLRLRPWARP